MKPILELPIAGSNGGLQLYRATGDLVTISEETDTTVSYSRQGGGFMKTLPRNGFHEIYKPVETPVFKRIRVEIDGFIRSLPAYGNGMLWNGWQQPYFDMDGVLELCKAVSSVRYDTESDSLVVDMEDGEEPYSLGPKRLLIDGNWVKVYPGGDGWCWDLADEEVPL